MTSPQVKISMAAYPYSGHVCIVRWDSAITTTPLIPLLTVAENKDRWVILKKIYYGGFDSGFVAAIDTLMADEKHMK
jgi:hypothetical protein